MPSRCFTIGMCGTQDATIAPLTKNSVETARRAAPGRTSIPGLSDTVIETWDANAVGVSKPGRRAFAPAASLDTNEPGAQCLRVQINHADQRYPGRSLSHPAAGR